MSSINLTVQVTASALLIRSGPSTSFVAVAQLANGTRVSVNELSGTFYHLSDGRGWISKTYTKLISNNGGASASSSNKTSVPPPSNKPKPKPAPTNNPVTQAYQDVENILDNGNTTSVIMSDLTGNPASGTPTYDSETLGEIQNSSGFPRIVNNGGTKVFNYALNYDFIKNNLNAVKNNLNISFNNASLRDTLFTNFNRFKIGLPDIQLGKSFSYVIFTRPDLNFFNPGSNNFTLNSQFANDPLYYYLNNNNPNVLRALTAGYSSQHKFHPYLSNQAESFDLSDEYIQTIEHGETFTGYKVQYGTNSISSNTAGTFSISYTDDRYYSVYKTHKAWVEYISRAFRGAISPKEDYITHKILDYACSVYYFICGADGETILFWSKYFGVFPTNTPASASSWSKGGMVKIPQFNVNYSYSVKEDFNPLSLAEFNMNSDKNYVYKKIYDPTLLSTGKTMSGAPFIETSKDALGKYIYKLRFRAN